MPAAPVKQDKIRAVRKELEGLALSATSAHQLMSQMVKLLHERMLKYNWVGFYMLEKSSPAQDRMLVLGPFQGAMTPHTRIPLNQGICGAAASTGKTIIVDDVTSDPRYLACSVETKSEIVVPVFARNEVVGELDIDSHFLAAFNHEDRELVEYCAGLVGKHLEKTVA
jgi:L-methionine (R)-S-oxide reductase